jgi:hypothetical protein
MICAVETCGRTFAGPPTQLYCSSECRRLAQTRRARANPTRRKAATMALRSLDALATRCSELGYLVPWVPELRNALEGER